MRTWVPRATLFLHLFEVPVAGVGEDGFRLPDRP
jgi:hypothetical protein